MSSDEEVETPEVSSDAPQSSEAPKSVADISKSYKDRLNALHKKRQEARKLNHEEVVEEDRISKLPKNFEARKKRKDWELEEMEARKECEERGEDFDRNKALNIQADVADKIAAAKKRKKNPDTGFANYEAMSMRQYERLTNNIKPDMKNYHKMKTVVGESEFYPSVDTLITGSHYPTDKALAKLSDDVKGQAKKREQYHRRRMFDPEAPIDYINERNRKFNQKLERFYGEFTQDIKEDLERGTAI
ncbi:unnamed protein product [Bursaphelenchus okinawaensis]|uniref:Pre-mRNA-splicing factor SYF2 n=1 Tax=Bursaphelenchus okinawaensis TaxID=465554 RepID=A0A811LMC3_9BILA|nr:unnamed protein product [Bursaphelenchus okinawaensis]CAG9124281.1 unnamed protein product [Bursaphelenchus okinawaensis]